MLTLPMNQILPMLLFVFYYVSFFLYKACKENQFQCGDGLCISKYLLCDRSADCDDSSDEYNTFCSKFPFSPLFIALVQFILCF